MARIQVADSLLLRLRGLSFRDEAWLGTAALLLRNTRSVHTFGMRFRLDLVWLDGAGRVVRVDHSVPPRRVRGCRQARHVVETAAGRGDRLAQRLGGGRSSR